jgi:serine/threonine-protein kinase RsbW
LVTIVRISEQRSPFNAIDSFVEQQCFGRKRDEVTKPRQHGQVRIPKTQGSEKIARDRAGLFAASVGFGAERIEDIKTAVSEASLNAIEHALTPDPSETILIEFEAGEGDMQVSVSSKGQPFVPSEVKPDIGRKLQGKDRPRGWGLFLIRQLADKVEFDSENDRTTVRMKFQLKPEHKP